MNDDIVIRPWTTADRDDVIQLIVGIQQNEFDLPITADDQPDLTDVEAGYRAGGGEFLVARATRDGAHHVVGTIAAIVFEDNSVAVRKMFVDSDHRGWRSTRCSTVEICRGWHDRDWPRVNLHVYTDGADEVDRMLQFRDHLRRDDVDRVLYERTKRELAAREWDIVQDYADAKTDVVAAIMSRAT